MLRIILAFIAAPLLPSMSAFALAQLLTAVFPQTTGSSPILGIVAFSPLLAVPATVVFGIPMFFLFRAKGWLTLEHAILGGGIVGVAAFLTLVLFSLGSRSSGFSASQLGGSAGVVAILAAFGMLMGAIFWFVGLWKPKRGRTQQE